MPDIARRLMDDEGLGISFFSSSSDVESSSPLHVGRIIVPTVPASVLSPNARPHWAARNRAFQVYKRFAWAAAYNVRPLDPLEGPVRVDVQVGWSKGRKKMDDDNLLGALKAFTDGITEAGWWLNDKQLSFGEPEQISWGKIDKGARGHYPDGFVVYDVFA